MYRNFPAHVKIADRPIEMEVPNVKDMKAGDTVELWFRKQCLTFTVETPPTWIENQLAGDDERTIHYRILCAAKFVYRKQELTATLYQTASRRTDA